MSLERLSYEGHELYKWVCGPSTFLAAPTMGARLMNWHLAFADGSFRDILYWPTEADYSNIAKVRGGNPILFPFAGRCFVKGQPDCWQPDKDKEPLPMPRNGFARQSVFRVESATDVGFSAVLEPDEAARVAYPYDYEFSVHYRFAELSFCVELRLRNEGKVAIPWSAGHHFYFQLPWHDGAQRKDYALHLPAKKAYRPNFDDGSLEEEKDFAAETDFGDPKLVDRVHLKLKSNEVRFGPKSGEEDILMRHGFEKKPPAGAALVTWTEADNSPFYCVEPWMGPPNAPEHKTGLHVVKPGQTQAFTVEVLLA